MEDKAAYLYYILDDIGAIDPEEVSLDDLKSALNHPSELFKIINNIFMGNEQDYVKQVLFCLMLEYK